MSLLILTAVMSLAAAADAPAPSAEDAPPPSAAQMQAAEKKADKDRVICKREIPVGSHRPIKTCLTKAQWQEWEDLNKDKLNAQTLQNPTPDVAGAQ